jgi:hypothetical protein
MVHASARAKSKLRQSLWCSIEGAAACVHRENVPPSWRYEHRRAKVGEVRHKVW